MSTITGCSSDSHWFNQLEKWSMLVGTVRRWPAPVSVGWVVICQTLVDGSILPPSCRIAIPYITKEAPSWLGIGVLRVPPSAIPPRLWSFECFKSKLFVTWFMLLGSRVLCCLVRSDHLHVIYVESICCIYTHSRCFICVVMKL